MLKLISVLQSTALRKCSFGLVASTGWTDKQFISPKGVFWIKIKPVSFGDSLQPTFKTQLFSILTSLIFFLNLFYDYYLFANTHSNQVGFTYVLQWDSKPPRDMGLQEPLMSHFPAVGK